MDTPRANAATAADDSETELDNEPHETHIVARKKSSLVQGVYAVNARLVVLGTKT